MISAVLVFITATVILIQLILRWKEKRRLFPPGPIVWPIIGNAVEISMANPTYPHLALSKLAKKYGNIMGVGFGSKYGVVISGHEEMENILKKSETCESRSEFPYVRDRSFNKILGIIFNTGDKWRTMRRFTVKNLREFGFGRKTTMEFLIKQEADGLLKQIRKTVAENDGIWAVDPQLLSTSVLNILWTMVGGDRFEHDDKKLLENLPLNEAFAKIIGNDNIYNLFPILKRWFPKLVHHDAHMKVHKGLQDWMKVLIEQAKIKRSKRLDTQAQSFIEVFLDEIEKFKNTESDFTEEQLIVILLDLFFAGAETTSMTLNWAILFLTLNPSVQRKLQEEIKEALSLTPNITLYEAEQLTYLRAVLLEVSRLGLVAPLQGPRESTQDIHYNKILIPSGSLMYGNIYPVFMDEEFWGDPEVFRPERFLFQDGDIIPQLEEKITIFGYGTRVCLGQVMVWDSLTMFLIELLGNLSFEPIKGKEPSAENPIAAVTIKPRLYSVRVIPNNNQ